MGEASFRTHTPLKPLNQFRCHVKYITRSRQRVDVQNLVGVDSAVTELHMRFFVAATGHSYGNFEDLVLIWGGACLQQIYRHRDRDIIQTCYSIVFLTTSVLEAI